MAPRARSVLVAIAIAIAIALAVGAAVTAFPVAAGGGSGPEPGRFHRSTDASDASVRLLPVGDRPDGRAQVVVAATFECGDLELEGVVLAPVKGDGSFRVESGGFTLTGGGTDEVDAVVVVRGQFRDRGAEGSIDAEAEAFDNAGTTGTCEDEVDWAARAGTANDDIERIGATRRLGAGPATVAAAPDAAYVATAADDAGTRLHRVNAVTGDVAWEIEVEGGAVESLAATTGAVWAVVAEGTELVRFDAATGSSVAEVALDDAGTDQQLFSFPVVANETAVWVATGDLYRIDPTMNTVVATIDLGDDAADAALAFGAGGVYVAIESSSPDGAGRLLRVDPATNAVVAEADGAGDLVALAADDEALWGAPFFEDVQTFDPTTLGHVGTVDVEVRALAAAPPGAWMLTEGGVAAYDAADPDEPAVRIPIVGGDSGSLAAAGDTVWVWDARLGTVSQVEAG